MVASQSAKRAWLSRLLAVWAIVAWVARRFEGRRTVRVGRNDDVVVTVVPRERGAS